MGDIISFVEKAHQEIDLKETEKLEEKLRKNKFDFDDFLNQIKQIKKMGSVNSLISMIPGANKAMKNAEVDEKVFVRIEAIILSMTKNERGNPNILNGLRRRRIAEGSGTSIQEVNRLLKQFEDMRKMMKGFSSGKMKNLLKGMKMPPGMMNGMKFN